jgi:hypothetical protein
MLFRKTAPLETDLFTACVGPVGSGKTYIMVLHAISALRARQPVFTNVPLDLSNFDDLKNVPQYASIKEYGRTDPRGPAVVSWSRPLELMDPNVRCGTVLFDELGALVNNREYEIFPFELTLKLVHLRKSHLTVFASVQVAEMADKNIRQFYNRVWFVSERHPPFTWLFPWWRSQARPALSCRLEGCTKNHKQLTVGDRAGRFPWRTTYYRCHDVDPKYTGNKEKHNSRGNLHFPFDAAIANAYQSAVSVEAAASAAYNESLRLAGTRNRLKQAGRFYKKNFSPPEAATPPPAPPEQNSIPF